MITEQEYLAAKKIVDEYERMMYQRDGEDFNDDDEQYDFDYEEDPLQRELDECTCGAYTISNKTGEIIKVSDCIC